ncbi:MAG TPA: hypothetical protein VK325_05110 [Pseudoxanthomonas sp.]|nr:hypothetical protein [Pseudoxanthomonas sp.]
MSDSWPNNILTLDFQSEPLLEAGMSPEELSLANDFLILINAQQDSNN